MKSHASIHLKKCDNMKNIENMLLDVSEILKEYEKTE